MPEGERKSNSSENTEKEIKEKEDGLKFEKELNESFVNTIKIRQSMDEINLETKEKRLKHLKEILPLLDVTKNIKGTDKESAENEISRLNEEIMSLKKLINEDKDRLTETKVKILKIEADQEAIKRVREEFEKNKGKN